jgi:hypothetical protein
MAEAVLLSTVKRTKAYIALEVLRSSWFREAVTQDG